MGLGKIFPLCYQGLKRNPAIKVNKIYGASMKDLFLVISNKKDNYFVTNHS